MATQTVAGGAYTICENGLSSAQSDAGLGDSLWLTNALLSGQYSTYATGTANLSASTVTGVGTTFIQDHVGGLIYWPSLGTWAFIAAFNSATSLGVRFAASLHSHVANNSYS